MPMGCIKCSREDLRQESPRPVERASRGRAGLLSNLQRDGDAIPKGNDRGDHPRVLRQPFVVGPDGLRLLGSVFAGHIAAPQDVVRHEESANSEALDRRVQHRGISGLVDVVEDVVERTFEVLQNSVRIADENLDLRGDAGLLHVLPGNRGGLGIVLDRDELAIVGERASEPCARVSDRGAELEDPARADRAREDMGKLPSAAATIGQPSFSPCCSTARNAGSPRFAKPSMYSSISSYTISRGRPPPPRRASCSGMNLRGRLTNAYPT